MSTLEETIERARAAGKLKGLTLWPVEGRWQANAQREGSAWCVAHDEDPAKALAKAIAQLMPARVEPIAGSIFD